MLKFQPKLLPLCVFGALTATAYADDEPHVVLEPLFVTAEAQVKQSLGASLISQSDLANNPVKNDVAELVRKMPGVNLTGNSSTGQRGNQRQIDIRGMGPENTLILVDGKPITSRHSVRYGWRGERDTRGDSQWVPTSAIAKIEVLRGPSASRYGNGAMGGVVNIITKKVSDELTGTADVYFATPHNHKEGKSKRVSTSISGAIIPQKLGFRAYGGFNKTDMDDPTINPLVPYANYMARAAGREGVENKDVGLRLTYEINPKHSLNVEATYGRQGNQYAGDTQYSNRDATASDNASSQRASNALLQSLLGTETNVIRRDAYAVGYDGEYHWGQAKLTAQYDHTKNTRLNEGLAGGPEGVITSVKFEDTKLATKRLHGEATIPLFIGVPQNLTIGTEYVHDKLIDHANTDEGTATGTDPRALFASYYTSGDRSTMTSRIVSAYAENNLQLSNKTQLVLAGRYDHHNHSGGNFSPALNVMHKLNDSWSIKAGIARAYKVPNLYQNAQGYLLHTRGQGCPIYLGRSNPCVLQGNANLKPETAINSEFGVQYHNNHINASATYFHSDYKDKIVSGTTVLNTQTIGTSKYHLLQWENVPKAKVEGIEGSFAIKHGKLSWNNNLTYMITSINKSTGNPLSLVPDYTWNSMLGYDVNDQWKINMNYTRYGRQKARQFAENNIENSKGDGRLSIPDVKPYGIYSLNTAYRFNDRVRAMVGINNVFDTQKLRDNSIGQTYNEAGRTYFASLNYEF